MFMEFKDWILQKFLEWERTKPRRQSQAAFARYLGINPSSMSQYLSGDFEPRDGNLQKIADKLGAEVYTVLGFDEPDPFPERLRLALESARDTIISRGLVGDSPEAEKVIIDAMSAAGYRLIVTKDDPSTN